MTRGKSLLAVALVALMVLSSVGAVAANDAINYDEGPNPYVEEKELTVAEHDRDEMSSVLEYFDDDGDVDELPAEYNESLDEPVEVRFDRIEDGSLGEFPRKSDEEDNAASALDDEEWSTDGDVTVSDGSDDGIDAVEIASDGVTDGTSATATYDNFSVDSDAEKRVPILIGNVDELASDGNVTIEFVDEDGDSATVMIDSDADATDDDVMATSTGNGYVWQERLANLDIEGGDGQLDEIDAIDVTVNDADATITLTGIDAEKKSFVTLGETVQEDEDGDDEEVDLEVVNGVNESGYVGLTSLDTMGETFDDAVIHDLRVKEVRYTAEQLDADDVDVEFTDAEPDYPNWDQLLDVYYRIEVPSAIDLSHSGLTFESEQMFASSRYTDVEYAEDEDDDFDDIDSWSDLSSTYDEEGETHELDGTVSEGSPYVFHATLKLNSEEVSALQDTDAESESGGGGIFAGDGDGGGILGTLSGWLFSVWGMLLTAGGIIISWRRGVFSRIGIGG